ncbi:hypothetical protein AQI84_08375 [Streptomyces griseorubiginosus]|nr:hypothetical protein AQI84_08375 [Streptomyces griseorubiginosus]
MPVGNRGSGVPVGNLGSGVPVGNLGSGVPVGNLGSGVPVPVTTRCGGPTPPAQAAFGAPRADGASSVEGGVG